MLNLLTLPRTGRKVRNLVALTAEAVRSLSPRMTSAEDTNTNEPANVFTADEMPAPADIDRAAQDLEQASDQARRAERGKRAAKKILDRLPAGRYGAWVVERVPSSRETVDLDAIRATYKTLGLGAVPMKACAPSLKVHRAQILTGVTGAAVEQVTR